MFETNLRLRAWKYDKYDLCFWRCRAIEWTDVRCGYSVMTSASGNEALDKGHAIRQRLSKVIQHSIGTVELGKFVRYIIVNWVEWLWNRSDSFVICFCGPESAQRSKEFLSFLWPIKNVALIYSVTICQQKTKDCALSRCFEHKLQDCCFYHWCLPLFITSLL